jgi:hypothetical protein
MKLIFILFLISFSFGNNFDELSKNKTWTKLLHLNSKEIKDKNFYFTTFPIDSKQELLSTLKNQNCENVCKFPARYKWLSEKLDLNISFSHCKDLNKFINKNLTQSASIVYVSSYLGSPISYFGHIFLKMDSKSELFSTTIGYAAKINSTKLFSTMYKGLTGGLEGKFLIRPFFELLDEYNNFEQRTLFLYPLNLTKKEIEFMLLHFYELYNSKIDYGFYKKNCAYHILYLLDLVSDNDILKNSSFRFTVLPSASLDVIKKSNLFTSQTPKVYLPSINKMYSVYKTLPPNAKNEFKNIINSENKSENLNRSSYKNELSYLISNYYEMSFKKFHIYKKDYNQIKKLVYKTPAINATIPKEKGNTKLEIYLEEEKLGLKFKPFLFDRIDEYDNDIAESTLNILNFDIKYEKNRVSLEELEFINIFSLPINFDFYKPMSWRLYLGANRDTTSKKLHPSFELALGKTYSLNSIRFYILGEGSFHFIQSNKSFEILSGISFWNDKTLHLGVDTKNVVFNTNSKNRTLNEYDIYLHKNINKNFYSKLGVKKDKKVYLSVGVKF